MATRNQVDTPLSGVSGSGSFAGTTSPTFVTPILGVASATSLATANLSFDVTTNSILSTNTNGNISFIPNGTGSTLVGSITRVATTHALGTFEVTNIGGQSTIGNASYNGAQANYHTYRSAASSIGSHAALVDGNILSTMRFYGDDGTAFQESAGIYATVSGTVSTGVMPSKLDFYTTTTGGTETLGMTLTNAQVLTLANPLPVGSGGTGIASLGTGVATALGQNVTGSGGIALATSPIFTTPTLGAATATSINFGGTTLNTYTESTFTPAFTFASVGDLSVVYTQQQGYYTRIGNLVNVAVRLAWTPTYTTSASFGKITGFPFTPKSTNGIEFVSGGLDKSAFTLPTECTQVNVLSASGVIYFTGSGTGVASAILTTTQFVSGVAYYAYFSMTYQV